MSGNSSDSFSDAEQNRPEELFVELSADKLAGNDELKLGNFKKASEIYEKIMTRIDEFKGKLDEDLKQLQKSVYSNLSLSNLKSENYRDVVKYTTILIDEYVNDAKALSRRILANIKLSEFDAVDYDLDRLARLDAVQATELRDIAEKQKIIYEQKIANSYKNIFKSNINLYDDLEQERLAAKRKAEEEERELHIKFDNDKRAGLIDENITFEDYKKEEEEKKKKEYEAMQNKISKQSLLGRASSDIVKTDDLDLDEEDKKVLEETTKKGYCYFKDHAAQHEKMSSDFRPQKLEKDVEIPEANRVVGSSNVVSQWNKSGVTYEEIDTTAWCQNEFKDILSNVTFDHYEFSDVEVNGLAQIMVNRGTVAYFYDFTVSFNVVDTNFNATIATITLDEVNSNSYEEVIKSEIPKLLKLKKELEQVDLIKQVQDELTNAFSLFEQRYSKKY